MKEKNHKLGYKVSAGFFESASEFCFFNTLSTFYTHFSATNDQARGSRILFRKSYLESIMQLCLLPIWINDDLPTKRISTNNSECMILVLRPNSGTKSRQKFEDLSSLLFRVTSAA
jgi:hypothetical protein